MNDTPNITLLIADDDPSHLLLCEAALAGAGFLVHTASDGQEAVERFPEVNPDVVVLDVMMPRMTGIEACRHIRTAAGQRLLPILMLTGRNDLQAISEAFAAGASDFAQKGLNPRLLVERVRFLLRDRALQEELRASRAKLLLAQRIARVGHWELAADGRTLHASPMLGELLGLDASGLTSYDSFVKLLDPAERVAARQAFVTCATGHGGFGFDHRIRTADGNVVCVHQEAELVEAPSGAGDPVVIVTLQDLTRLHRAEETVRLLSYFDTVSGLPNRRHLEEQAAVALAEPSGAAATAVVTFRVHHFDRVAQARGDDFANKLVIRVARRIEAELERFSQGGTILWRSDLPSVCRTADGELSLLLRSRVSAEHVATVVHAILESVSTQQPEADVDYVPAISAGAALVEGAGVEASQLVSNAHAAAEAASTPRSCAFFSPMPQAQLRRRLLIESSLRTALDRRELQLVYQPRVALDTMELSGVECLVRWDHPQFGTIRPDEFVAIAEESGVIVDIGRWMIEEAARQLAAWRERYDRTFFAAVSVTGRQLRDPRMVSMVLVALDRHRLPPGGLQLEVSEASLIDATDAAQAVLKTLQAKGVRIGLDDFGTGHSSLGQIRRLPLHSLKLDRSLVADLYSDPWAQGVTAAVLAMAHAMQIRTVADGIDDPATLQMLHALGCDELQGLHVAPPMKPLDFEEWLECGGARHLARRDGTTGRELPELPDGAVDDIMKWVNG
jgi:EAL domain-containing protein (putative c-di-GMP-specific phosphodiesterase class I)/DNA-binding response OmpR family regulator/GGDEF domain-containing protein